MSISPSQPQPSFTLPLAMWLAVQLGSLSLSVFGIKLSYGWVDPPHRWAVEQMLVAQIAFGSILLLSSFRGISFSITALLTGAAMLSFAHTLAGGQTRLLESIEVLIVWILTIHVASRMKQDRVVCSLLLLVVAGGTLLQYAAIEFGSGQKRLIYSPVIGAIVIARHGWQLFSALHFAALLILVLATLLLTHPRQKSP